MSWPIPTKSPPTNITTLLLTLPSASCTPTPPMVQKPRSAGVGINIFLRLAAGRDWQFFPTSTPGISNEPPTIRSTQQILFSASITAPPVNYIHGHGMPQFWVLEHASGSTYVHGQVLEQLTNGAAPMAISTVSCFTGQFDTVGDPVVEHILRTPNKGQVLALAPSRSGVPIFTNPNATSH